MADTLIARFKAAGRRRLENGIADTRALLTRFLSLEAIYRQIAGRMTFALLRQAFRAGQSHAGERARQLGQLVRALERIRDTAFPAGVGVAPLLVGAGLVVAGVSIYSVSDLTKFLAELAHEAQAMEAQAGREAEILRAIGAAQSPAERDRLISAFGVAVQQPFKVDKGGFPWGRVLVIGGSVLGIAALLRRLLAERARLGGGR